MTDQIITPLPEVVDRYTICQLKLERLDHTQIDVDSMKEQLEFDPTTKDHEHILRDAAKNCEF